MENKTFNARIKNKRDTSANWTSRDPVLLDGEIIVVDTANGETRFKVGDGTKTYSQLPFSDEIVRGMIEDAKVTVDDELSSTSANPVQNKVIKAELDKKFDKTGGTINGNVYISQDGEVPIYIGLSRINFETYNGKNGAYFCMENRSSDLSKPVISFYGSEGDEVVTLAHIEDPTEDYDAANKHYVDNAVAGAGMTHPIVLQKDTDYGDTLPTSPQTGQLFFKEAGASLFDLIYPVGAVYISMNNTSPATLFGGSWTKVEGKFLLGTSSAYPSGSSGGEETHTLTVNEMPSHLHDGIFYSETQGATSGSNIGLNNGTAGYKLSWTGSAGTANTEIHTNLAGGGASHNNMPPYLAVNMWYRVA